MNVFKLCIAVVFIGMIAGCHQAEQSVESSTVADYVASADKVTVTTSDNISDLKSSDRRIIKTADIKCRVDDIHSAVKELEVFTQLVGGFVEKSHSASMFQSEQRSKINSDSIKIARLYKTTADLTIRIPLYELDTLADKITSVASFLDYRKMDRDDVTHNFLANVLKNKQAEIAKTDAAQMDKAKEETRLEAIKYKNDHAMGQVDRRIANLKMLDESNYATVSVQLYQPDNVVVSTVADVDEMLAKPFSDKIVASFGYSADIMQGLLLVLITFWPVWLIVGVLAFFYKRSVRKKHEIKAT